MAWRRAELETASNAVAVALRVCPLARPGDSVGEEAALQKSWPKFKV